MSDLARYTENPFLNEMPFPHKKKSIKVTALGKNNEVSLVNHNTGEVQGTHVATYKKVDSQKFVKLFAQNVALTFDLNSAGIKALNVLIWTIQEAGMQRDVVNLGGYTLEDFLESQNSLTLSLATFKRGLNELEKSRIIAKTTRKSFYYINPHFVFNGDRIAFSTVIEREDQEQIT